MTNAQRIRLYIANGDLRNAAGQAIYEVFGGQRLGKTKRARQCAELQDNFTIALESLREHLVSRLREVSIYEGDFNDEREVEPIVVYMRCLEALGVDVDREAEHVRQVMRDAVAKSEASREPNDSTVPCSHTTITPVSNWLDAPVSRCVECGMEACNSDFLGQKAPAICPESETARKRPLKQLTEMVERFNRDYPVGTTCILHMDSGRKVRTRVTRKAIVMGLTTAVAWFEGVSGCYAIDRVRDAA